jgi:PAS domain-containing protein
MNNRAMRFQEWRPAFHLPWLTTARAWWTAQTDRISAFVDDIPPAERKRLRAHAIALLVVAAATAVRFLLGPAGGADPFLFFYAAIAFTASFNVWSAAAVATLASLLVVRTTADVSFDIAGWFCVEGLAISLVVIRLAQWVEALHRRLAAADQRVLELKAIEREGQLVRTAFSRLEDAAGEHAMAILDADGRIVDWRAGAVRLYGHHGGILGANGGPLFCPDLDVDGFRRLLVEARRTVARHSGRHRRFDGTEFEADVEISPLSRGGADGFAVIIHDLTYQRAWQEFAASAAQTQTVLREEADSAQRQLATLQDMTDPSLNALGGAELVTTLLERLRIAIGAEGIAFADVGRFRPRVFCAPGGVQGESGVNRHRAEGRSQQSARTLLIHNDAGRLAEMSVVQWPEKVSSLIAVPVVRGGATQAVIEVVNTRGFRSTDWEIALVQVVAARIAGLVRDDAYADAGAVARDSETGGLLIRLG